VKRNDMDDQHIYQQAKKRAESKIQFYIHLGIFLGVNILLLIINLRTSPDYFWFLWPFAGWGIGVVIHGLKVLGVFDFSTAKKRLIEKEMAKEKYKKQMEDDQ
jgi:hypothetical protein